MDASLDPHVEKALLSAGITYEVIACDPELADTAAFCTAYGYLPEQSANTILVASKGPEPAFAACVILATTRLDVNKKVCLLMGVKKASFANAEQTENITGMMIGGVVAIGLPASIPVYIDAAVMEQPKIVMGGGNRSSKIMLSPGELNKLSQVEIVDQLAKVKEA